MAWRDDKPLHDAGKPMDPTDTMFFSGIFSLPWWGAVIAALALTHVTIAAVTIYLHRSQSHHALALHPLPSHFFRFWLWLTTGMVTRQWIAVHRKHHAKCETAEDPHSPQRLGIQRVLWGGMFLYMKEAKDAETLARYGAGAPSDWLERHVYAAFPGAGIALMAVADMALFGFFPGLLVYGIQMAWIPFLAAGVINGLGHHFGYRSYACNDASTNIVPWGILIGGEELHNNHHAFVTSAKLSAKWYEIDIGWTYIRLLALCGLARVRRVAPTPRFIPGKPVCDLDTLQAIITHRYEVLAKYNRTVKRVYAEDIARYRPHIPRNTLPALRLPHWSRSWLQCRTALRCEGRLSARLDTLYAMGQELSALWECRAETREQLLQQLQNWCQRAEASTIVQLQRFARELRCYG
jgi:stearoyl-CoA desaturase (delta-9 desaturase)